MYLPCFLLSNVFIKFLLFFIIYTDCSFFRFYTSFFYLFMHACCVYILQFFNLNIFLVQTFILCIMQLFLMFLFDVIYFALSLDVMCCLSFIRIRIKWWNTFFLLLFFLWYAFFCYCHFEFINCYRVLCLFSIVTAYIYFKLELLWSLSCAA